MSIRRRRGFTGAAMRCRESCDHWPASIYAGREHRVRRGRPAALRSTQQRSGPTSRITEFLCSSDRAAASASTQRRRVPRLKARVLRQVDGDGTGHDANGLPPTRRRVNSCDS